MVAFGGAAPLHACRLADRLAIDTIVVPPGAGVGSAIGFLVAPISYEAVRTQHQRLDRIDLDAVNDLLDVLIAEASGIVGEAAGDAEQETTIFASMRYLGQGHEIDVELPVRRFEPGDDVLLLDAFDRVYRSLYTRVIPGMTVEVLTWRVKVSTIVPAPEPVPDPAPVAVTPDARRRAFDSSTATWSDHAVYVRDDLPMGARFVGPALVVEDQTTTLVTSDFDCRVDGRGHLILSRVVVDEEE